MEYKKLKDVEKLHEVERFILTNGRQIKETDNEILMIIESIMQDYTYGWYILQENMIEQLKNINQFKLYILNLV